MTALKKPIKIKVIDEDEVGSEEKVVSAQKKVKKAGKKKSVDKKTSAKETSTKKVKKVAKIEVKKNAKQKNVKKKVLKKKVKEVSIAQEAVVDPIAEAVRKVSAVKNIVMAREDTFEDNIEGESEKVVKDVEEKIEVTATDALEVPEEELEAEVTDYSEDESDEGSTKEETDEYDVAANSVKEVIASSIKKEQINQERIIDKGGKRTHARRSIAMYRKIAIGFAMFAFLLVAVILYFSFVRVTIVLIPNQERINSNVIFDVHDTATDTVAGNSVISGVVQKVKTDVTDVFDATGETILGQEAVGKVVIYNSHNKNQPLVATTRLLPVSDPDKLFRISNTVNVPAGGSVEVGIYADEPGPEMAIDPTKFTIPGLWAGLQDKIYAKSSEAVVYQEKVKKYILQDDIDNGKRYLKQKLIANVKKKINSDYGEFEKVIYKTDENSIKSETKATVNDEVDNFEMAMQADVVVVAFDSEKASKLAEQKFISSLDDNKVMLSFDSKNIIYSLNNFSLSDKTATINATFEGRVSLKDDSGIVDKEKIVGLNRNQLDAYLKELPDIAGYEVKFYPPFINKIPKLIELSKIKVEIKK